MSCNYLFREKLIKARRETKLCLFTGLFASEIATKLDTQRKRVGPQPKNSIVSKLLQRHVGSEPKDKTLDKMVCLYHKVIFYERY